MQDSTGLPPSAPSVLIDFDYRKDMMEAAGSEVVQRLTLACFVESSELIQRVLTLMAEPGTPFPVAEVTACHRLAGSCAAIGLVAMSQAWYALEQAVTPGTVASATWRSVWDRALAVTQESEVLFPSSSQFGS